MLANCIGQERESQECQALVDGIIATYRNAMQRGASPREKASVIEHLDFLLELIEQTSPLNHDLRVITSYSIHYTKLYDAHPQSRTTSRS